MFAQMQISNTLHYRFSQRTSCSAERVHDSILPATWYRVENEHSAMLLCSTEKIKLHFQVGCSLPQYHRGISCGETWRKTDLTFTLGLSFSEWMASTSSVECIHHGTYQISGLSPSNRKITRMVIQMFLRVLQTSREQ